MCKRSNALSRPVLMLRGLDGFLCAVGQLCSFEGPAGCGRSRNLSVAIARGPHLFPFRTEQLSPSAPMVLGPRGPGRVGRRRFFPSMSAVAIVLIVLGVLVLLVLVGGFAAARRRDREHS